MFSQQQSLKDQNGQNVSNRISGIPLAKGNNVENNENMSPVGNEEQLLEAEAH